MTTVTGLTAARMLEIEAQSIVDGHIDGDDLILTRFDAAEINAGSVRGPQGPQGLGPGMIPGEIRMWPSITLPDSGEYGTWVFANGAIYVIADHPLAAANIDNFWDTFEGASAPAAGSFRVPDLRGLTPAGMDNMVTGGAANRVVRADADTLGGVSGEETHVLTAAEMPSHAHTGSYNFNPETYPNGNFQNVLSGTTFSVAGVNTGVAGGDDPHENMQPTVFVPYIVCLDG